MTLRRRGRLAMTSWDYHSQPRNRPPQVDDHRPLAEQAGFGVLTDEETADWRHRCTAYADFLPEHVDETAAEAGVSVEAMRATWTACTRASTACRRFLLVAERR